MTAENLPPTPAGRLDPGELIELRRRVLAEVAGGLPAAARAERAPPAPADVAVDVNSDPGSEAVDPPPAELDPLALRYAALLAHHRAPWRVGPVALDNARATLAALATCAERLAEAGEPAAEPSPAATLLRERFHAALAGDLDTPAALEVLWQVVRADLPAAECRALVLELDAVLALGLSDLVRPRSDALPPEAQALIDQRRDARLARDWSRSDDLRDRLAALGIESQDSRDGSTYRRT